jgi:hypothetical protein
MVTVLTIIVFALCLLSLGLYFYAGGLKADFEEAKTDSEYWYKQNQAKHDRLHGALSQAAALRLQLVHMDKAHKAHLSLVYRNMGL